MLLKIMLFFWQMNLKVGISYNIITISDPGNRARHSVLCAGPPLLHPHDSAARQRGLQPPLLAAGQGGRRPRAPPALRQSVEGGKFKLLGRPGRGEGAGPARAQLHLLRGRLHQGIRTCELFDPILIAIPNEWCP